MMTSKDHGGVQVTAAAFRYSADPRAEAAFLELVGLRATVSNEANSWLELRGQAGVVDLHSVAAAAAPEAVVGATNLIMIVSDLDALAERLASSEVTIEVWDEAFGRQAVLRNGPAALWVNEEQVDLYGYQAQEEEPRPVTVVIDYFTAHVEETREILDLLGFEVVDDTQSMIRLDVAEDPGRGVIRLHRADGDDHATLGIETAQDLGALVQRLQIQGFVAHSSGSTTLEVLDPDGQPVIISQTV